MSTPVLTQHARDRCAEMGISTKVAKRIVQTAHTTFPGTQPGTWVVLSQEHPEYRVIVNDSDPPKVITVAFEHKDGYYIREGQTFRTNR